MALNIPISSGYLCFFSSARIPRLNTINTMGTLLGVHPSVPERKEHPGQPKKKKNTLISDLPKQQKMPINDNKS